MSSAHNVLAKLQEAQFVLPDPGDAGAIKVPFNFAMVPIVTAAAETRTLVIPAKEMQFLALSMVTDGGDCVVTVASAYDEDVSTTITFSEVGQQIGSRAQHKHPRHVIPGLARRGR